MDYEKLKENLKIIKIRSTVILCIILLGIMSIGIGATALFYREYMLALITFSCGIILSCILFAILSKYKIEQRKKPYIIPLSRSYTFEQLCEKFSDFTSAENVIKISSTQMALKLKSNMKYRMLITNIEDFSRASYDAARKKGYLSYNKKFKPAQKVSMDEACQTARLNIIYSDVPNAELLRYMSKDSSMNLSRVEVIFTVAVVGNTVYVPPLVKNADFNALLPYKKCTDFIFSTLK